MNKKEKFLSHEEDALDLIGLVDAELQGEEKSGYIEVIEAREAAKGISHHKQLMQERDELRSRLMRVQMEQAVTRILLTEGINIIQYPFLVGEIVDEIEREPSGYTKRVGIDKYGKYRHAFLDGYVKAMSMQKAAEHTQWPDKRKKRRQ